MSVIHAVDAYLCSYELHGCQVLWAIKDDAIGNAFFDKGAATFFLPHLESSVHVSEEKHKFMDSTVKRLKYGIELPQNYKCGQYMYVVLHFSDFLRNSKFGMLM